LRGEVGSTMIWGCVTDPQTTKPLASAAVVAVTAVTPVKLVFMAMIAPTGKMPRPVVLPVKVLSPEKVLFALKVLVPEKVLFPEKVLPPEWVLFPLKVLAFVIVDGIDKVNAVPDFETFNSPVVPSIDLNDATPALVKAITSSVSACAAGRVMS